MGIAALILNVVVLLLLAGVVFAVMCLRRERARALAPDANVPVCRRCGYRMHEEIAGTCSECGAALTRPGAIVPASHIGAGVRRLVIWGTGAPALFALVLVLLRVTGVPGTAAVPGTLVGTGTNIFFAPGRSIAQAHLHINVLEKEDAEVTALTPDAPRRAHLRLRDVLPASDILYGASVRIAGPPGSSKEPPAAQDFVAGSPPLLGRERPPPTLAVDAPGADAAAVLIPDDLADRLMHALRARYPDAQQMEADIDGLRSLVAWLIDHPEGDPDQAGVLPQGVHVVQVRREAGGTPAVPMRPFFRWWMVLIAAGLYIAGALLCVLSEGWNRRGSGTAGNP